MTDRSEGYSSTLLCFTWIKLHSLRLLGSESVVVVASYGIGALGYGPHTTPDMLTHITKPLSNPCRPRKEKNEAQRYGAEAACAT